MSRAFYAGRGLHHPINPWTKIDTNQHINKLCIDTSPNNGSLSKVIFEHFTSQEISHIEDLDLLGWEFEQEYWFALMNISHSDSSNFCKIHQFDRGVINFFHSPKKLPILHISYYLLFWPMSDTWMTMKHVNFIEYKQLTSVWLIYIHWSL